MIKVDLWFDIALLSHLLTHVFLLDYFAFRMPFE